jgi:hypothetical protein
MSSRWFLVAVEVSAVMGVGCGDQQVPSPEPPPALILGVQSNLAVGPEVGRVGVVARADGMEIARLDALSPNLSLPLELPLSAPPGTTVDVVVAAYDSPYLTAEAPSVRRDLRTRVPSPNPHLLRVRLDRECIANAQLAGELLGPTCAPPTTCVSAECVDTWVAPERLEPYAPDWAQDYADECRTDTTATPTLEIGAGWTEYEPIADGGVVQVNAGNQGGYHVWISLQSTQFHRAGVITTIEGRVIDLDLPLESYRVAESYAPVGDGRCQLVGFRDEMPAAFWNGKIAPLLGQRVEFVARAVDESGVTVVASKVMRFSEDVIKQNVE